MKFGVSMPNVSDPAAMVDLAVEVEQNGWDGFFFWDNLQIDASRPETHDPWVLLGAIAARTSRIKLGALVTPVARRRPWKLAKEITTLDHLSGGRVIVGVGLGTPPDLEYEAFGEPGDVRTHAAKLDEALPLLDAFLRGDPVDHDGPHYQVHAHLNPPARQRPRPPIWVAATLPHKRPVARAARWDGIFPLDTRGEEFVSPAAMAELLATIDVRPGYDVVAMGNPSGPVAEFEQAGVTWMIDGPSSPEESFEEIRKIIRAGVPGR